MVPVLQRAAEVLAGDYVIPGSDCTAKEYGAWDMYIPDVMTGAVRNGRSSSFREMDEPPAGDTVAAATGYVEKCCKDSERNHMPSIRHMVLFITPDLCCIKQ